MTRTTDFDQLLNILRSGTVPPDELARLARAWKPDRDPPFLDFVAGPVTASVGTAEFHPSHPDDATATFATPDPAGLATPPADEPSTPGGTTADYRPGPSAFPLPPAPPGGRYVPLRLHRSGGLGSVWVARDTVVGRDVALKTLRPDRRPGSAEEAGFIREAQLTGRLEHPCVVPVYDLPPTRAGAGPCYVMRFVAGRTLAEATAAYHAARAAGTADPLALVALLDAVVTVARAVGFAHGRGVLHRDLKGQNVVLGDHGEVFLLDWGLAVDEADAAAGGGMELPTDRGQRESGVSSNHEETHRWPVPARSTPRSSSSRP
ncbi:MAG TPA: protein kinase [Urbifossiella sp.]|nr:protein kinase [Urbifossiella sp.]